MKRGICLFCCLASLTANAAVYKSVDAEGNVVYSDTPHPGAKEVTLPPSPTYTPAPTPVMPPTAPAAPTLYSEVRILKPAPDATLRDNSGAVEVQIGTVPALNTLAGDTLVVELDGQRITGAQGTALNLANVDRGAHTLKALILDTQGKILGSSDSVTFYVMRDSALRHKDAEKGQGQNEPAPARNPGNITDNPNKLSDNPNKLSDNPNKLSDNPNIITPVPAP